MIYFNFFFFFNYEQSVPIVHGDLGLFLFFFTSGKKNFCGLSFKQIQAKLSEKSFGLISEYDIISVS